MAVEITSLGNLIKLEGFLHREEAKIGHLNMAFVAIGQAGGRIATDISRLGYYGVYMNTCEQDLQDTERLLKTIYDKNEDNAHYKIIRLEGYNGAKKDRITGKQAVIDNKELIETELIKDKKLKDADFVWIACSLGGGTGCGAVSTIAQIVSGIIRKDKRVLMRFGRNGEILDIGKATVGIIAAIPDNNASPKMKLNAAEALEELRVLQEKKLIGSVLLIDNEKIINDYLKETNNYADWMSYGNATVASIIGELAVMTSLPGVETLDQSEMIDIWSTPGFLFIGKNRLYNDWKQNYKHVKDKQSIEEKINALVEVSFKNLGVFADDYDFSYAVHGGLAVITNENNILNYKEKILLHRAINKILVNPEVIHYGVFNNHIFGTYSKLKKNENEAIIYTIAVIDRLPKRILEMTKNAFETKRTKNTILKQKDDISLSDILSKAADDMQNSTNNTNSLEIKLDSILSDEIFTTDNNSKKTSYNTMDDLEETLKKLYG